MSAQVAIKFGFGQVTLGPAPIRAQWILEGNPTARNKFLSRSADGTATSWLWDCTAGRFNWHYDVDETVYIIEGSVTLRDHEGTTRTMNAGDTVFFPAGSSAEWHVETYIRKVAFLRVPLPRSVLIAKQIYHGLKRLLRGGSTRAPQAVPEMFPTG
jgi:uncharacterized protein